MVMRVIDSTSESEVMTPMTRSDEIGRHRSVVGPVEVEATCRFESCLQWVHIQTHLTDSNRRQGVGGYGGFGPLAGAKVAMCQHLLRLLSVFEYGANGEIGRHSGGIPARGSNPLSSRQTKIYGRGVGSSPTLHTIFKHIATSDRMCPDTWSFL